MLFDFGGIESLDVLSDGRIDTDEFNRFWSDSPVADRFYRGSLSPDEFADAAVQELSLDVQPSDFLIAFTTWLRGPYPGVFNLLYDLRAQVTTACLSNTNELDVARFRLEFALHDRFDHCFFSNEIGLRKPEAEAYAFVLKVLGLKAGNVAFFDDTLECVVGARAAGLLAFHTVGVSALHAQLNRPRFPGHRLRLRGFA